MAKYKDITNEIVEMANQGMSATEIAKNLGVWRQTVYKKLKEIGITIPNYHNELKFDNSVFDNIDTEEKAYWLGFLYADGSVSSSSNTIELSLKGDDIEHLNKFKIFLNHTGKEIKISDSKYENKIYKRCRFAVTDKHFKEQLILLGCTPRKSLTLTFPNLNIFNTPNLVYDFIRGYIDGDGCITYTSTGKLVLEIIGTKEFLEGICKIFSEVFTSKYYKDKKRNSNTYFISCSRTKASYILEILYRNSNIYLQRKYDRLAVLSSNW